MSTVSEETRIVGLNVSALRQRADLTQQDLADACEVSRPRIAEIESGRHNPTVDTLAVIAKKLKVDIAALFKKPAKKRVAS